SDKKQYIQGPAPSHTRALPPLFGFAHQSLSSNFVLAGRLAPANSSPEHCQPMADMGANHPYTGARSSRACSAISGVGTRETSSDVWPFRPTTPVGVDHSSKNHACLKRKSMRRESLCCAILASFHELDRSLRPRRAKHS